MRAPSVKIKKYARAAFYVAAFAVALFVAAQTAADAARFAGLYAAAYSPMPDGGFLPPEQKPVKYIKWAEFNIPLAALERAYNADVKARKAGGKVDWIYALALLSTKYSGSWGRYKASDMDAILSGIGKGDDFAKIKGNKYYPYFYEVCETVLKEFVGDVRIEAADPADKTKTVTVEKYGLRAFSPIAYGYGYSEFDDFGTAREYGYKRRHLGHDMMGRVGTPIIAVEGGLVEEAGWNRYGGWRVGIRSPDKKRYYYYAHLRKDHPFAAGVAKGATVSAGDVLGYLGMTGYSVKENVNNIQTPHLHFGLQLIFNEAQKDGVNQIWVDVYDLTRFLRKNRSEVRYISETKEYVRKYNPVAPSAAE